MKKIIIAERTFKGSVIESTFSEAMQGKVYNFILEFIQDKPEGTYFYGISSHHRKDGFNYFVGIPSLEGTHILPKTRYIVVNDFQEAYDVYSKLMKENYQYLELFDGKIENDHIPVKIEKYIIRNNTFECIQIEVPIKE